MRVPRTVSALVMVAMLAGPALAQRKVPRVPPQKPPVITINPLALIGELRSTLLLQFLERADEELERASLERRSFVENIVRSIDDETL